MFFLQYLAEKASAFLGKHLPLHTKMTATVKNITTAIAAALLFAGCSDGGVSGGIATAGLSADTMSLRVAVTPTIDCLPIYVAHDTGIFDRESLSVVLVPFTAHMDCDTAIAGGTVHAMATDLVRSELLVQKGVPLRHVAATGLQWQLLTGKSSHIKKLSQMYDKMMAMTRHSATAMIADRLVDSSRLEPQRVFRIQVNDVHVRANMMEAGIVDAALLPEPQATQARNMGCNMLYDSAADSLAMGVVTFSEAALHDTLRLRQMYAFIKAYNAACDSISACGLGHYRDIVSARCQVTAATADSMIAQRHVSFAHACPPLQRHLDSARGWLKTLEP